MAANESGAMVLPEARKHCCSVTLVIVGETLDPDAVTAALALEPDQSWRKGERKCFIRPDGTVLPFNSIHEEGGWKRFLPLADRDKPLFEQVFSWLERLRSRRGAIEGLRDRGWSVELDGFTASNEVLVLSHTDLREMADLGVGLSLTVGAARVEMTEGVGEGEGGVNGPVSNFTQA